MNYGKIRPVDTANGPGVRVSLFVSGCPHQCKGCFNPELWSPDAGEEFDWVIRDDLLTKCAPEYITGLSLLGGEPLAPYNIGEVELLCAAFKRKFPAKTIWCYTGYRWEDIKQLHILKYIDVLVEGPFVEEEKDLNLRFRGSANQRIIDIKKSRKNKIVLWADREEGEPK